MIFGEVQTDYRQNPIVQNAQVGSKRGTALIITMIYTYLVLVSSSVVAVVEVVACGDIVADSAVVAQ